MKKCLLLTLSILAGVSVNTATAQPGPPKGPSWDPALSKLFGDNSSFTASLDFHDVRPSGQEMIMPGKMEHVDGKARFEMDMLSMKGGNIPPQAAAQMKQMGMDKMVSITRRDKGVTYIIFPGKRGYVEMPLNEPNVPMSQYKSEATKLGAETVDGHDCVKNKVVVTGPDGATHEATVWNATDLKDFPIKIQAKSKAGEDTELDFTNVKMEKSDDSLFDPPSDFTKYDNMLRMMMGRAAVPGQQ